MPSSVMRLNICSLVQSGSGLSHFICSRRSTLSSTCTARTRAVRQGWMMCCVPALSFDGGSCSACGKRHTAQGAVCACCGGQTACSLDVAVRLLHSCSGSRCAAVPTTMPRCSPMAARRLFHSSRFRRSRPYFSTYALRIAADMRVHQQVPSAVDMHAHDAEDGACQQEVIHIVCSHIMCSGLRGCRAGWGPLNDFVSASSRMQQCNLQ